MWFKFEITQDSPFRKFLEIYFLMLCVDCDTHMSGHPVHAWCLWRPEEGIECPWIRVSYCCKLPRECWKWNTGLCKGLKCFRLLSQLICPQEFSFDIYGQRSRVDVVYILLLALNFWKLSVHRHLLWGAETALILIGELEAVLCIYIALRAKKYC